VSAGALSPEAAIAWLRSLWVDLGAVAVFGADGTCLAGDPALAERAAVLLDAGAEPAAEARGDGILAVRSTRHGVAAALGPRALERLARADLRAVLAALDRG
jgi:hypothetical protein